MSSLRLLLPLTAVAASLALPAAAGAGGGERVFFPGDCETNAYKPRTITVACADGNFQVRRISWTTYGSSSARGTGTARVNDCQPTCAGGRFRNYPARVVLSRVTQCGDVPQFRRLAVTFTRTRPRGFSVTERRSTPCADAPE